VPEVREQSRVRAVDVMRGLWRDPILLGAGIFLILLVLAAIFADVIEPYDPTNQNLRLRNQPPMTPAEEGGFPHVLGTDPLGRDMLSRLLHAARISLAVGAAGVLVSATIGSALGAFAGFFRGRLEDLVMRVVDLQMSIPFLLIALIFLFVFGPGFGNVIIILAIARWPIYARVARSLTLSIREEAYVEAAEALGSKKLSNIRRHVLPNALAPLLVLSTLEVARLILAEATLSFLGLGVQPPDSSWGLMIGQGRDYLRSAAWNVYLPGIAIFLTALSINLVATGLRSLSDPVQRSQWLKKGRRRTEVRDPEPQFGGRE